MKVSKQELLREALETGFRPEIMEKVKGAGSAICDSERGRESERGRGGAIG
jgi:hypothetical protein